MLTEKVSGFGYNGEYYDAATGMLNLRARQYEPAQARFSQRDSEKGNAANARSLNAYLYCQNDAINYFDASGAAMVAVNMTDGGGGRKSNSSSSNLLQKAGQTIKSVVSAAASAAAVAKAANDQALVNSILKESRDPVAQLQRVRENRAQAQATTPTVTGRSFLRSTPLTACMTQEEYVDYWATAGASGQNGGWNTWGSLLYPGEIHNAVTKHLSEKHGLTREKWFSSEEALYRLDLYSPISNEYWEVKPVSYISSKTLRCSILDPQMAKYDEFAVRGTPLGNDEFPYKNYDVYTYSFEPGIVYYKFIKREQQVPTYAFAPEPETEKQRESAYDNNGSTRGRKVAPVVYILAGGIIIVGTLFEDAWTLGAGIADDPITLSAGAAMVREGLKELWPILVN